MDKLLERLVWERAGRKCEYCLLPYECTLTEFEVDHIIPIKHRGRTTAQNLALACFYCNSYKGPNLSGIDPHTRRVVSLFHPRRHKWPVHFVWNGPVLIGKTAKGRATIEVLQINHPEAVAARQALIDEGVFPPLPQSKPRRRM